MKAAFLGRFQPFHEGHHRVVEKYSDEFEEFCIVIGSSSKSEEQENPLDLETRKQIIRSCVPEVEIISLEDRESDEEWLEKLEERTEADIIISQNDLVKELVENHPRFKLEDHELYNHDIYSGTEIRRRIRSGEEWRYLVPDCAKEKIEEEIETIRETGIEYEYEPGWKKENAFHGTSD